MIFPTPFIRGKFHDEYSIENVDKDTTFRYQKFDDLLGIKMTNEFIYMGGVQYTMTASGYCDDSTEIWFRYIGHPENHYPFVLPKGKIDTTWHGEIYADRAEIVFLHKKAKSGNLKLTFRLGQEVKNTL